jgi:AcrR family transcriptional regulator
MYVKRTRPKIPPVPATRARLVAVARRLFAHRGYPGVSVDEIVRDAGVTKGSLYHHFADKQQVFKAVVEQIQREIYDRLAAASSRPGDAAGRLRAACEAYLDACVDEEVGRIVVLESPGVLGWETWCKLHRECGLDVFIERLRAVSNGGAGVETEAHMLLGALNVAGRVIAESDDRGAARRQVGATIDRVLAGIARA